MNIGRNQLAVGNQLAGLRYENAEDGMLARQFAKRQDKSSTIHAFADLQKQQVVTITVVPWKSPPAIKDLHLLRQEEAHTEEPITAAAFYAGKDLLEYVNILLGIELPAPTLVPDGEGGIRIEWSRGTNIVRVIVPALAATKGYVYQRVAGVSAILPFSLAAVVQTIRSVILAP